MIPNLKKTTAGVWFWGILFLSVVNVYAVIFLIFKKSYLPEMFLGWAMAYIFNFIGLYIKLSAIGKDIVQFFLKVLLYATINLAIFVATVLWLIGKKLLIAQPFVVSIVVAYFTFLIYDILIVKQCASGMPSAQRST